MTTFRISDRRSKSTKGRGQFLEYRILPALLRCRYPNSAYAYAHHFAFTADLFSAQVLKRCYTTVIPTEARTYISTYLNPPDLYGPFWTLTTLIFSLYLSSSLGASIAKYLSTDNKPYEYDFGLLSLAVTLVYSYGLALPVVLWLALRYLGVGEWSVVEAISVWGYGQFVWIPVAVSHITRLSERGSFLIMVQVLCVIPVPIVRWVLVALAFGLSGWFLGANIYPILASVGFFILCAFFTFFLLMQTL